MSFIQTVTYAECHTKTPYAECHIKAPNAVCRYAECHLSECHYAECRGTSLEALLVSF